MSDQDKFTSNVEELGKIIKENIWFGSKEEAYEFLEAIKNNHIEDINAVKNKIRLLESKIEELEDHVPDYDDDAFVQIDIGVGTFIYMDQGMNLLFQQKLEQFIDDFKNNRI